MKQMTASSQNTPPPPPPRGIPLGDDLFSYITTLVQRAPCTISFRTGSGRILSDLLMHWPVFKDWEDDAHELCQRITNGVYPLTSALFAQAVEIEITFSPTPIGITDPVDAMSTLLLFDLKNRMEYQHFLSPTHPLPPTSALTITKGIVVLCRPLNYNYHTVKDDRENFVKPDVGIFELAERQIADLLNKPDFVERERGIIALLKNNLQNLPQNLLKAQLFLGADALLQNKNVAYGGVGANGLPLQLRDFERQLMTYINDTSLSAELRGSLRQIIQNLRTSSPQNMFGESARLETAQRAIRTAVAARQIARAHTNYTKLPKAIPVDSSGRLDRIVTANRRAAIAHIRHMAASPTPVPGINE